MKIAERYCITPVKRGDEVTFRDSLSEEEFSIPEFIRMVEQSLSEAFPRAGYVECRWRKPGSRHFECRVAGYALEDHEEIFEAMQSACGVAKRFRMGHGQFREQLNGWSFCVEVV